MTPGTGGRAEPNKLAHSCALVRPTISLTDSAQHIGKQQIPSPTNFDHPHHIATNHKEHHHIYIVFLLLKSARSLNRQWTARC